MEQYLHFPDAFIAWTGATLALQSVVRLRIVDARTCEEEATTVLDKQNADLKSGRYIYIRILNTYLHGK
jgi:hypothetical protein